MKKITMGILSILLVGSISILALGYYKFNYTQDDIFIQMSDGSVISAGSYDEMLGGIHYSWDTNTNGINDYEDEGSCDHTIDYTEPRFM